MITIDKLRNICYDRNIVITKHANTRLKERGIELNDIKRGIDSGEIIKQYEDDKPFPSCLILGKTEKEQYIHIVVSIDGEFLYIITAYHPNIEEWESNFKTRKGSKL